jgi:excisionase family DNA binding protein
MPTTARKPGTPVAEVTPRAVNVEQARALLGGVSRPHLYRLIQRGELKTVKSGARRLVPLTAIDDYLARLEAQSA